MELLLNLAWVAVAAGLVFLWLNEASGGVPKNREDRRRQLIAIAILIAILFPVISVSDDLLAMQNASESDNYLRRDHLVPFTGHPIQPVMTFIGVILFAGLGYVFLRFVASAMVPVKKLQHPELSAIENRPPPAA